MFLNLLESLYVCQRERWVGVCAIQLGCHDVHSLTSEGNWVEYVTTWLYSIDIRIQTNRSTKFVNKYKF